MTFYGLNERPAGDYLPDWLMGGNRKRRVLAALADRNGWTAEALVEELNCARSTVYETIRAVRDVGAVITLPSGRLRLDRNSPVGASIISLARALADFETREVDRPPRARRVSAPGLLLTQPAARDPMARRRAVDLIRRSLGSHLSSARGAPTTVDALSSPSRHGAWRTADRDLWGLPPAYCRPPVV